MSEAEKWLLVFIILQIIVDCIAIGVIIHGAKTDSYLILNGGGK